MTETGDATKPLPPPRLRTRVFFAAWQLLGHLLLPFAILFFVARSRKEPLYRQNLHQRFGLGSVGQKGAVWVFATSLGETRAVSPLVRMLLEEGYVVCLTHASPAGLTEGHRLFDDPRVIHRYVPFDFWWSTWLFLVRLRPVIGLVVEGEFWPGHVQVANWLGIPMLHINGNLNRRSLENAKKTANIRMDILTRFRAITTKSEVNKQRYVGVGVDPARVLVVGEKLLELAKHLLSLKDPPRIIWAPRSPQRFGAVADLLRENAISTTRRSEVLDDRRQGSIPAGADVLLADSIGEMNMWYQMADLVFVGATLVDKGGHNISEPLALGRPVLLGPSIYGITFPAEDANRDGAVRILPDIAAVTDEATRLLTDGAALAAFTEHARSFSKRHVGATRRTMDIIERVIEAQAR